MTDSRINNRDTNKLTGNWMIVSWRHIDHVDAAYGELLATVVSGTYDDARLEALKYVPAHSPVGIVSEVK